jgi:hypothetical protein
MDEGNWTRSDKLAVALFCLATAMALILFLAEKTPIAVGIMLLCIAGFLVYPVIHFAHSRRLRIPSLMLMLVLVAGFGWSQWPKSVKPIREPQAQLAPVQNSTPPPTVSSPSATNGSSDQQPQQQGTPKSKSKTPTPATQVQSNSGSRDANTQIGTAQGPVAIAPNGIANAAPNYGSQSVTNTPPARQVPADKESDFKAALETAPGSGFGIVEAGTSDDTGPLDRQISRLAHEAGWRQSRVGQVSGMNGGPPPVDGLQCYLSGGWNTPAGRAFKAALAVANLKCDYYDSAYSFDGITLYGGAPTLVIGRNTGP